MTVAIVKYNAGNIFSVSNALRRLGIEPVLTDDPETLRAADRVIFPGVGEASSAMSYLRERGLDACIRSLEQPVLAICLGMQLLCDFSEENDTDCLGLLPYTVRRFADDAGKIPHMGWNNIYDTSGGLFESVELNSRMYFVHSYFVESGKNTTAKTSYGTEFSAAVECRNFYGVQFHPEKSGTAGEKILENFLNI